MFSCGILYKIWILITFQICFANIVLLCMLSFYFLDNVLGYLTTFNFYEVELICFFFCAFGVTPEVTF